MAAKEHLFCFESLHVKDVSEIHLWDDRLKGNATDESYIQPCTILSVEKLTQSHMCRVHSRLMWGNARQRKLDMVQLSQRYNEFGWNLHANEKNLGFPSTGLLPIAMCQSIMSNKIRKIKVLQNKSFSAIIHKWVLLNKDNVTNYRLIRSRKFFSS
jgi:hypothetical protein